MHLSPYELAEELLRLSVGEVPAVPADALSELRWIGARRHELRLVVELKEQEVGPAEEGREVVSLMAANGLVRGEAGIPDGRGLKVIMMCELPANALLADEFLEHFDGFSIGSNDLTQLTLGLDRDSGIVAHLFDERNPAVKKLLAMAIQACRAQGKYVGICGQGPSDHPELAKWLMEQGIETPVDLVAGVEPIEQIVDEDPQLEVERCRTVAEAEHLRLGVLEHPRVAFGGIT